MQYVAKGVVGDYDHRVGLKVRAEFLGGASKGQSCLLHL